MNLKIMIPERIQTSCQKIHSNLFLCITRAVSERLHLTTHTPHPGLKHWQISLIARLKKWNLCVSNSCNNQHPKPESCTANTQHQHLQPVTCSNFRPPHHSFINKSHPRCIPICINNFLLVCPCPPCTSTYLRCPISCFNNPNLH